MRALAPEECWTAAETCSELPKSILPVGAESISDYVYSADG